MKPNLHVAQMLLIASALAGSIATARAGEPAVMGSAAVRAAARPEAAAAGSAKRAKAASADEATRGRPRVAPRMLDDIRIEGEIPVPQVLFITARDQRRFMEFQHHRYQVTSLELGRATPAPSRLVVSTPHLETPQLSTPSLTTPSPDKAKQEDPR